MRYHKTIPCLLCAKSLLLLFENQVSERKQTVALILNEEEIAIDGVPINLDTISILPGRDIYDFIREKNADQANIFDKEKEKETKLYF